MFDFLKKFQRKTKVGLPSTTSPVRKSGFTQHYFFTGQKNSAGFSLVELLIVSSIFALITSIVMVRFSLFNNQILTTNLAYDIALSIRQAQTFGINVRGFDSGGGAVFTSGYGIYFDSGDNNSYIFYADADNDNQYDTNELVEQFNLLGGHTIKDVCGLSGGSMYCFGTSDLPHVNIVFTRPDPDASIKSFSPDRTYERVTVTITSPQGIERTLDVYLTGQIAIDQS